MWWRIGISLLIKLFVQMPVIILGLFIVPIGLKYGFTGLLWWWGNAVHPDDGGEFWRKRCGSSWWCAYQWFALRNPVANFGRFVLSVTAMGQETLIGTREIGDKKAPGWYWLRRSWAWEYYYISQPYQIFKSGPEWFTKWRCVRFRAGWKLEGVSEGTNCGFVFAPNPLMPYSGVR